jgi:hypothetical protein
MTVYLPKEIGLFRQAFDGTCDRILNIKNDVTFYTLYVELTTRLQEHSLFNDYIHGLETESLQRKQEFCIAALTALENCWMKLWKYHCHTLKYRKQLVRIKRMVTTPRECLSASLYRRLFSGMWEFCRNSSFCRFISESPRLFQKAQSELRLASIRFDHTHSSTEGYFANKKVIQYTLGKKSNQQDLHKKIFNAGSGISHLMTSIELISSDFFSPEVEEIEKKFFNQGQGNLEVRKNIQTKVEANAAFCWQQIKFLQQCCGADGTFPALKPLRGRWASIRETAWKLAQERCEIEVFLVAQMAFKRKLSPNACSSIDSFLSCENQFHRNDYETYLKSLKNHIHAQLLKIQDAQLQVSDKAPISLMPSPQSEGLTQANKDRIEGEKFIIEHANAYWAKIPSATFLIVFGDYEEVCPRSTLKYRLTKWKEIIRSNNLDPRTSKEKKLAAGRRSKQLKKTSQ